MVAVGQVDVADMVNDLSIEFFGDSLIETAVPRLHVKYRNLQALGHDRRQATIRIPENKERIRLFLTHHIVRMSQDIAQRLTQTVGDDIEKMIRLPDLELFEKNLIEIVVMVLS